ncbi:UNVERIFIED_CONTAM: hypothetical protein K2H54_060691 [Gekko kuhli]
MNEFHEEMTCPICLEFFKDPVTVDCGHSFCQACFTQCCGESDTDASCPQCKGTVQPTSVRPDRRLANLVELVKKAEKGKDIEEIWGGLCTTHEEPLKLFCKDDQILICVVCDRSTEHRSHSVLPMEEAAQEYKGELGTEKLKNVAAFQEMQNFLEEKEYFWLAKLNDLEKEIQKRREENVNRLSEEISRLGLLITEMEEKCQQPAAEFLQDISITLSRYEKNQEKQHVELYPGMEEMVRTYVLKTPALERALGKCEEFLDEAWNKVNVTPDQNTAHSFPILSEDQKNTVPSVMVTIPTGKIMNLNLWKSSGHRLKDEYHQITLEERLSNVEARLLVMEGMMKEMLKGVQNLQADVRIIYRYQREGPDYGF